MAAPRVFLLFLLLLAVYPAAIRPEDAPANKALSPAAQRWVEHTFSRLTTDEKIGQIVFPTYFGGFESTESADFKELMARVVANHIGGFILATRRGPRGIELSHVYETAVLTNQLQRAAAIPLLVGADFERGTVMRVEEGTAFPHAMAVGATGRPEDAYAMGRITAIEARAMGVHWAFAPVADVNSNPDNPIINIRSFGEDPKRVAEYVAQFVRGVEENGAMATAKHFPGHGDTAVDSHLELPLVKGDRARLNAVEFVPFEAAIGAGVSSVMTGHLAVPALEPDPDAPATLSARVLTGVLRGEMQFHGLVITDALDMGGVTKGFPPGEVAVRALLAGADVLLMSPVTDAALASVRDAVQSGRVPMARLDDAVRRVLEAKARLGLYKQREVDIDKLNAVFRRPEFLATAQDMADRGVTLLRNDAGLVPLDPRTTKRVLLLAVSADPDTIPAEPFEHELRAQLDSLESVHVDTRYFRVEETHLPSPDSYDLAICALTVRVADRKGSVGLPPDEAEMVRALLRAGKPVIMVGLGSPYLSEGFPEATTWLAAFSVQDVAQRAAARALLGQVAVSGKLPVSLPGAAPHELHVGDGMTTAAIPLTMQTASAELEERLKPVYRILEQHAQQAGLRFGVLQVVFRGERAIRRFGTIPVSVAHAPVSPDTAKHNSLWLGQIPPFTTTLIARLVETKQLTLETPVATILQTGPISPPEGGWRGMTVRQLLDRSERLEPNYTVAGKPSFRLTTESRPRDTLAFPQSYIEPTMITTLTGLSFDESANGMIFAPVGVRYVPAPRLVAQVEWEGLEEYSTDLAFLGQLWVNGGIYAHKRLLSRKVVEQFTAHKKLGDEIFTAGWEVSLAPGHFFSSRAYGWTSSDRESLWIDPEHELCVVFFPEGMVIQDGPPRGDSGVGPIRAQIHDAIFSALGLSK
ncbi:MAG TPA: glycoside hydrolase family 3 N-terminal domain-containing protein [Candidatus Acidoferrales bacterium]|nr:glycoside hydrolase family 3 N-terminal domain-containing protein [Candidatus Acidoferrales bacterium]